MVGWSGLRVAALVFALFLVPGPVCAAEDESAVVLPEFEYIQLAPLTLPVIGARGVLQQVSLIVSLELPYGKLAEVKPYEPRLADAYLQDLYGALGAGYGLLPGGVVDVKTVKGRLASITHRVVGPDKVHDVLLQVVQQRRM